MPNACTFRNTISAVSIFTKTLLIAAISSFVLVAARVLMLGEWRLAAVALVPALALAPLLLEVFAPGKYNPSTFENGERRSVWWGLGRFLKERHGFFANALMAICAVLITLPLVLHVLSLLRALVRLFH